MLRQTAPEKAFLSVTPYFTRIYEFATRCSTGQRVDEDGPRRRIRKLGYILRRSAVSGGQLRRADRAQRMNDMPEQVEPPLDQEAPGQEPAPVESGSSILPKLYVGLFLVGTVAVECAVAYLYIPNAAETAAMIGVDAAADLDSGSLSETGDQADAILEDQVEVDLGQFTVTAYQPVSNTTVRIDFHLYGTVGVEDQTTFEEAWLENTHRLRDQVIVTVRGCETTELTDAGLGLIKRKILEKTNRTLGKPLLQAVIFSDFSFIEQ